MPKSFFNEYDLPYSWPFAALSVWFKYPNPFAPHVVSMDVLDQTLDERTGKLRVERILGVKQSAPMWAVKLLGGTEDTYVREVTMIDPQSQSFEMTSTNLSLSRYLLVKEYITYMPRLIDQNGRHSDGGGITTFQQRALIECRGLSGGMLDRAARKIEDMSFKRFGDNAGKGKQGILHVCRRVWETYSGNSGTNSPASSPVSSDGHLAKSWDDER